MLENSLHVHSLISMKKTIEYLSMYKILHLCTLSNCLFLNLKAKKINSDTSFIDFIIHYIDNTPTSSYNYLLINELKNGLCKPSTCHNQ